MKFRNKVLANKWTAILVVFAALILGTILFFYIAPDSISCHVTNWLMGGMGKSLAIIALTIIGIGALLGNLTYVSLALFITIVVIFCVVAYKRRK